MYVQKKSSHGARGKGSKVYAATGKSRQTNVLTPAGTISVRPFSQIITVEEQLWLERRAGGGKVTQPTLCDVGQA